MIESKLKSEKELLETFVSLSKYFNAVNDESRLEKVKLLSKKIAKQQTIFGFCGHFSAGKSTIINSLVGDAVLPTSPIPTSANVVKLYRNTVPTVTIYQKDQQPVQIEKDYDSSEVQAFCKNGKQIEQLEIGLPDLDIPNHTMFMDTPGVDSTDDQHRKMTNRMLHLSDRIFYVADYNHVLSQVNLQFLSSLNNENVPVVLIINQVDKHNEEELPFEQFKQKLTEHLADFSINIERIFYTSMKNERHPHNQIEDLKTYVDEKIYSHNALNLPGKLNSLIAEHEIWLQEELEAKLAISEEVLESYTKYDLQAIIESFEKWKTRNDESYLNQWQSEIVSTLKQTAEQAYIFPYDVRKLAEDFLVSLERDFKVGLLFSKSKTHEERENRKEQFILALQSKVDSEVNWHIKQVLQKQLNEKQITDQTLIQEVQEFDIKIVESIVQDAQKKGALLSGEYILRYCEIVKQSIIKMSLEKAESILSEMAMLIHHTKQEFSQIDIINSLNESKRIKHEFMSKRDRLHHILESNGSEAEAEEVIKLWLQEDVPLKITKLEMVNEEKSVKILDNILSHSSNQHTKETLQKLQELDLELSQLPALHDTKKLIHAQLERLENQQFTVSLFGAFSAGKSSFANALLGKEVLPVSPNPMTASISRIHPATNEALDETCVITFKNQDQLLDDLTQAYKKIGMIIQSVDEAFSQVDVALKTCEREAKTFFTAFKNGYVNNRSHIGKELKGNLETYRQYVSNEEHAFFVEMIDLYIVSTLGQKGMTLVDTPGADSINSRHTDVSFDYIRNSDAILFVTYYNHPFSKADREFLIQLGRVKETLNNKSTFFILNAIDLAENDEELTFVKEYVARELEKFGIHSPSIYGVSSRESLINLRNGSELNSQMKKFVSEFEQFIEQDLQEEALLQGNRYWNYAIKRIEQVIEQSNQSEEDKRQKILDVKVKEEKVMVLLEQESVQPIMNQLPIELHELLYYVKQRVFYRFGDFFKEAFHPNLFLSSEKKTIQKDAMEGLLASVGYDLAQECRVTQLRLEKYIKDQLKVKWETIERSIANIAPDFVLTTNKWEEVSYITIPKAFTELNWKQFEKDITYKNSKSFFEKGENNLVKEKLQVRLSNLSNQYLDSIEKILNEWAKELLDEKWLQCKTMIIHEIEDQYQSLEASLTETIQPTKYLEAMDRLLRLQ